MKRIIVIEIDDAASPSLRKSPDKILKRLIRSVADQVSWGDLQRPLQDRQGNPVGLWRMTVTGPAVPAES